MDNLTDINYLPTELWRPIFEDKILKNYAQLLRLVNKKYLKYVTETENTN